MSNEAQHNNQHIDAIHVLFALIFILFVWVIVLSVFLGSYIAKLDEPATVPTISTTISETEVIETTDSTTAPIIVETTIMPTEAETIHIEETEPAPEVTRAPTTPETVFSNTMTEREMLACVIYQEAGGDAICDDCRRRVADIVLNRVADSRFPNTMYEVLTAKQQYGRFYWTGIVWPSRASNAGEAHAVERAYRIADEVLAGQHSSLYGNGYIWQAGFQQGNDGFWCCGHFYGR